MALENRIEAALEQAMRPVHAANMPRQLGGALTHALFPGGSRVRPTILLSVAQACGDDAPALSDAAAAALELIHCASLVHDDLPMFDDAEIRRGKPSVHRAFSEPLALLTGDTLIVRAFGVLAGAASAHPDRALRLVAALAQRTGAPDGICAGQAWESEPDPDLCAYHRAKTGALFVAATQMGAISAGHDPEAWEDLGALIGEAFQVADDLKDALLPAELTGKPAGQDLAHQRPNAVAQMGVDGASAHLRNILSGAIASIPACPGEARLAQTVLAYARRLTDVPLAVPGT